MTKLLVTSEIFAKFPDVLLGIVTIHDTNNEGEYAEVMNSLRQQESRIREEFVTLQVSEHPRIVPWREAYRQFGAKPKDYPSSIENLIRRVIKGHTIPHINPLVDIYNTISLRHIMPVGGEDLDQIRGDVVLTFAGQNENAIQLLGEKEERAPRAAEVIYKDDTGAICRRWNWKEADRTKLTAKTRNAFLITEALPPVDRDLVQTVISELAAQIQQYCGGLVQAHIIDRSSPEIILR